MEVDKAPLVEERKEEIKKEEGEKIKWFGAPHQTEVYTGAAANAMNKQNNNQN